MNPPQLHYGQRSLRQAMMASGPAKRQCLSTQSRCDPSKPLPPHRSSLHPLSDATAIDFRLAALLLQGDGTGRSSYPHDALSATSSGRPRPRPGGGSAEEVPPSPSFAANNGAAGANANLVGRTPALDARIDALVGRVMASQRLRSTAAAADGRCYHPPAEAAHAISSRLPPPSQSSSRMDAIGAAIADLADGKGGGRCRGEEEPTAPLLLGSAISAGRAAEPTPSALARAAWELDASAMRTSSSRLVESASERRRVRQLQEGAAAMHYGGMAGGEGRQELDALEEATETLHPSIGPAAAAPRGGEPGDGDTDAEREQQDFHSWGSKSLPTDFSFRESLQEMEAVEGFIGGIVPTIEGGSPSPRQRRSPQLSRSCPPTRTKQKDALPGSFGGGGGGGGGDGGGSDARIPITHLLRRTVFTGNTA